MRYVSRLSFVVSCAVGLAVACTQSSSNVSAPSASRPASGAANADGSTVKASVPALVSPINGVRTPEGQAIVLTVTNSTLLYSSAGPLSYRFETSSTAGAILESAVQPGGTGTTSRTVGASLQKDVTYRWRARAEYQGEAGPWSGYQTFIAAVDEGYNRPGALFDPLTNGRTIGTVGGSGNITWMPGQGIRINDEVAFVQYQLPQTYPSGEISAEVSGLNPGGPCCKPRIFTILDRANAISSNSKYMINVQYRGAGGAPDNAIAWKAVLGDNGASLEPDTARRNQSVFILDPSKVYLWQSYWTPTSVRVVVNEGSKAGPKLYDYQVNAYTNTTNWSPEAMYAFVGTNNGLYVQYDGSRAGMIVKNLWVGNTPRPASIP